MMAEKLDNPGLVALCAIALFVMATSTAQAASVVERYKNLTDVTNMFFWSDDPTNMTFASADLTDIKLTGWSVTSNTGGAIAMEGPLVTATLGKFNLDLSYTTKPFTFQFAEVLFDASSGVASVTSTGSIEYSGHANKIWVTNRSISYAQIADVAAAFPAGTTVVPIPNSVYLMASALGFMGFARRRSHKAMVLGGRVA